MATELPFQPQTPDPVASISTKREACLKNLVQSFFPPLRSCSIYLHLIYMILIKIYVIIYHIYDNIVLLSLMRIFLHQRHEEIDPHEFI